MGTWGAGSFENDAVLDWLGELDAGGVALVRSTLEMAADADPEEDIEVDDAHAVIGAAEIAAAGRGKGDDRIAAQPEVVAWVAAHRGDFREPDVGLARRAVERVLESSELQELWDEGGADNEWRGVVGALLGRLRPAPSAPAKALPPKTSAPKTSAPKKTVAKKTVAKKKPATKR